MRPDLTRFDHSGPSRIKEVTARFGRIGIGTFDDTSDWDDIELRGVKATPK